MKKLTYKACCANFIQKDALSFLENVLNENGIKYGLIYSGKVDFDTSEIDNYGHFCWTVPEDILTDSGTHRVYIGGTMDDYIGIATSVIFGHDNKKILWMSVESTRKKLGITEFKLS